MGNLESFTMMPVGYINKLNSAGNRKKARCFMEYHNDIEQVIFNSYGFYAKSWEVSKATAYAWVDEFANVLANVWAHKRLKEIQK